MAISVHSAVTALDDCDENALFFDLTGSPVLSLAREFDRLRMDRRDSSGIIDLTNEETLSPEKAPGQAPRHHGRPAHSLWGTTFAKEDTDEEDREEDDANPVLVRRRRLVLTVESSDEEEQNPISVTEVRHPRVCIDSSSESDVARGGSSSEFDVDGSSSKSDADGSSSEFDADGSSSDDGCNKSRDKENIRITLPDDQPWLSDDENLPAVVSTPYVLSQSQYPLTIK